MLLPCLLLVINGVSGSFIASSFMGGSSRHRRSTADDVPEITELVTTATVKSRFATVLVASKIVNTKDVDLEATFSVQIPETAFISNFSMLINGNLHIGKVYEKKEAQKKYNEAKEQGQSAGQVRHQARNVARGMDIFNVNVNVAAMSDVHFELTYQELLRRRLGSYEQRIMVQPLQVVNNLTLDLTYDEPQQFSRFTYREPNNTEINMASTEATVVMATPSRKRLIYRPSVSAQKAVNEQKGIEGEFIVSYDVVHRFDGGNIIYADGNDFFVHYFAIEKSPVIPPIPKNIMFVIDISGSMGGRKIEQTRDAMKAILPQLNSEDFFNILLFDDEQYSWQRYPKPATTENIEMAKDYVERKVKAQGGTNINGAMLSSVGMVANDPELQGKAGIIVFLTDGQPTAGETNIEKIKENIYQLNENRVSVFSLGFGMSVDFDFLKAVSLNNGGFAKRIYEESDAANQLEDFFKEVNFPLLKDVVFQYLPNQVVLSDLTRTIFKHFFGGSEIHLAGRITGDEINATVRGTTKSKTIELIVPDTSKTKLTGPSGEYTEKLWAYLTIKDLLRKKTIATSESDAAVFEARALNMSLKHNLVTPLTSLLVVQEDSNRNSMQEDMLSKQSYPNMAGMPSNSQTISCVPWFVILISAVITLINQ